ncbi:hypothetical protein BDQ17DRAFT_1361710 [Cyathus striatus]|nr:hypothetical protein BDQ17DRAFT_1361710 [Cyathus striatus]
MSELSGPISCLSTATGRTGIRTWVVGTIGSGIGYGIVCLVCFQCLFFLSKSMVSSKEQRMQNMVLMLYAVAMLVLSTMAIAANATITWDGILGSTCFQLKEMDPFSVLGPVGSAAFVLTNWAADGILIWRSVAIYQGCEKVIYRYGSRSLITVLFCYTLAEGIVLIVQAALGSEVVQFGPISYVAVSMSLNVLITAMIVGRIWYFRRISIAAFGSKKEKRLISIISMLLESAALIILVDLFYLIPFMSRSLVLIIPLQCIVYVQCIAPLMIIQRIALQKAWTRKELPVLPRDEKQLELA